jgi:hypothetical protein
MAAIADASEGRRVMLPPDLCQTIFGCPADALPTVPRRTVAVSAGGRAGKSSRLLAPKALHAALTVPLPDVRTNERGRSVLIAPDKDLAEQDLDYVRGYAEDSPILRRMLLPAPKTCVRIKRPDNTVVDVRVGAANRGGRSARARALVFLGLEETAFFFTDESHAVSDKEIYRAGIMRLVPSAQAWIVSTPWLEEVGLLEERIKADFGKHDATLVVARVSTRLLNPMWDPDSTIENDMRQEDPENAAREIDAIPMASGTSQFFDSATIARCFDVKPFAGRSVNVGAGADFGFTSDCTSVVLARVHAGEGFDVFDAHERRPTKAEPLKPSEAISSVAKFVLAGGAKSVAADGHYKEAVKEFLDKERVLFVPAPEGGEGKVSTYIDARKVMAEGRLRISIADPLLRARIRAQLRSIVKKVLPGGGIQITAPRKKAGPMGGTSHGDLVSGMVLALWRIGAGKPARTAEDMKPIGVSTGRGGGGLRSGFNGGARGSFSRPTSAGSQGFRCAVAGCLQRVPVPGSRCAACAQTVDAAG